MIVAGLVLLVARLSIGCDWISNAFGQLVVGYKHYGIFYGIGSGIAC